MPRTTLSPLVGIKSAIPADWTLDTDNQRSLVKAGLHALLVQEQVNAGTAGGGGIARDPDWDRDLTQLVLRATPHQITRFDQASGLYVTETVAVILDSLVPEVDDNGQVCAWIYEEPA